MGKCNIDKWIEKCTLLNIGYVCQYTWPPSWQKIEFIIDIEIQIYLVIKVHLRIKIIVNTRILLLNEEKWSGQMKKQKAKKEQMKIYLYFLSRNLEIYLQYLTLQFICTMKISCLRTYSWNSADEMVKARPISWGVEERQYGKILWTQARTVVRKIIQIDFIQNA